MGVPCLTIEKVSGIAPVTAIGILVRRDPVEEKDGSGYRVQKSNRN
jgi:hypothetical protein